MVSCYILCFQTKKLIASKFPVSNSEIVNVYHQPYRRILDANLLVLTVLVKSIHVFFFLGCYDIHHLTRVNATSLRVNPDYVFYYVNIGQNVVTGMIPLVSLVILNYLVYKHLKARRKGIFDLGK